jgi:uncharacterized membrane protein YbhN (UPF0104 family)
MASSEQAAASLGEDEQARPERRAPRLRNGAISLLILTILLVSILLAVPGLHGVAHRLGEMPAWAIVTAIGLEIASCVGYVLVFWMIFWKAPFGFAARVAWTEMAFGAAVPLGGAGSLAVGAWILSTRGMSAGRIAERSAVLFLLTSAINVVVLIAFGAGIALGVFPGPSNPLLGVVPAAVSAGVLAFFLLLPSFVERFVRGAERRSAVLIRGLAESIRETRRLLLTPDWRLLGAVGYLAFDIAVLVVCFDATGHPPPLAGLVLAYQIGYLANILPVPGGIGVVDAGLVGMLVVYGAKASNATAAVIAYHTIALWVPMLIGTIAFIRLQRSVGQPLVTRAAR